MKNIKLWSSNTKRKVFKKIMRKIGKTRNAQVLSLSEAIGYEKGAIVSKELIKKETVTVTLYSFYNWQGLSEHTAPFDALFSVIYGEATVFILKKPYVVKSGQMILMPANKPHSLLAKKRFKMLLVLIKQ